MTEAIDLPNTREVDLLLLDDALRSLEKLDPQQGRIVELRFFEGLSIEEAAAEVLGVSTGTVKRGWAMAKAWLPTKSALECNVLILDSLNWSDALV